MGAREFHHGQFQSNFALVHALLVEVAVGLGRDLEIELAAVKLTSLRRERPGSIRSARPHIRLRKRCRAELWPKLA